MWDFLKKAGRQLLQAGVAYAQNRTFILSLLQGNEADAHRRLRQAMHTVDDAGYTAFRATLSGMIGQAAQHLQQVQASGGLGAWGSSYEDRMAQALAEHNTGDHSLSSGAIREAQQMLTGLQTVMQYAEVYRAEKPQPQPQQFKEPSMTHSAKPDVAEIERMLEQFGETGAMPDGLMEKLAQIDDPDLMERLVEKMKAMGGEEVGSGPALNIKDYYVDGTEPYSLLWPLSPNLSLPMPFEELNRETQFHVLWGDNSIRLTEATALASSGKLDEAEAVFRECLERADQLDVPVLKAKAYEGLMAVSERRGDRQAAQRYLKLVQREEQRQKSRG